MSRRTLVVAITALAILAAGCGSSGGHSTQASKQLTDLRNVDQLRSLFNSRSGEPRLIVLVSPT
jgi:hypothetical protein